MSQGNLKQGIIKDVLPLTKMLSNGHLSPENGAKLIATYVCSLLGVIEHQKIEQKSVVSVKN